MVLHERERMDMHKQLPRRSREDALPTMMEEVHRWLRIIEGVQVMYEARPIFVVENNITPIDAAIEHMKVGHCHIYAS